MSVQKWAINVVLVLVFLTTVTVSAVSADTTPTATPAEPRSTSSLTLSRQVIASGGGQSSGGAFVLKGTIGQLDADPLHPASGGVYTLIGGFWPLAPATPLADPIFANGFEPLPP